MFQYLIVKFMCKVAIKRATLFNLIYATQRVISFGRVSLAINSILNVDESYNKNTFIACCLSNDVLKHYYSFMLLEMS